MGKISFQYRSIKETGNLSIRLIHGKEIDIRSKTSIQSSRKYWFKRTTRNGKTVNRQIQPKDFSKTIEGANKHRETLLSLSEKINQKFIEDFNNGVPIDNNWLRDSVSDFIDILNTKDKIEEALTSKKKKKNKKERKKQKIKTANLLSNAVEKMFVKYETNKHQLAKYKITHKLLSEFQEYKNKEFKIVDLNQEFADHYKNWGLSVKKYKKSYINKQLKNLRSSAVNAYENDEKEIIKISRTLRTFKMFKNIDKDKIVITLNYDEIDQIEKLEMKNEKLLDAKKAILIGCETGLRYSDMNKLVDENIQEVNGVRYWKFKTEKTRNIVQITITDRILHLIDLYGLPKTDYPDNGVKFNKDIKEVCRLAGITEVTKGDKSKSVEINGEKAIRTITEITPKYNLISSRTLRRSFATNYFGKIDTPLIMAITGHTTERQLKTYISFNDESNILRTKKQTDSFHQERLAANR